MRSWRLPTTAVEAATVATAAVVPAVAATTAIVAADVVATAVVTAAVAATVALTAAVEIAAVVTAAVAAAVVVTDAAGNVAVVAAMAVATAAVIVESKASIALATAVSSSRKRARTGVNSQSLEHLIDPLDGAETCLYLVDELSRWPEAECTLLGTCALLHSRETPFQLTTQLAPELCQIRIFHFRLRHDLKSEKGGGLEPKCKCKCKKCKCKEQM